MCRWALVLFLVVTGVGVGRTYAMCPNEGECTGTCITSSGQPGTACCIGGDPTCVAEPGPLTPPTPPKPKSYSPPSHIQKFGYYGNGSDYRDTVDRVAGHANLAAFVPGWWPLEDLEYGAQKAVKGLVYLSDIFFDSHGLRADAMQRWADFAQLLRPHVLSVAAFYLFDEPYLNLRKTCLPHAPICMHPDRPTITRMLDIAAKTVKKDFPKIPISFVETGLVLENDVNIPDSIDWVGIDCYPLRNGDGQSFDRCENHSPAVSIPRLYKLLGAKLKRNQRLILVPEAHEHRTSNRPHDPNSDIHLNLIARRFYDLALANPRVVAVIPYAGFAIGYDLGVFDLPKVAPTYRIIGETILKEGTSAHLRVPGLYRLYDPSTGAHFYTIDIDETAHPMNYQGFIYEGMIGRCYAEPGGNTVPLFHLWNSSDNFYTTDPSERYQSVMSGEYLDQGAACWVLPETLGTCPLYRFVNGQGQHFYTSSASEASTVSGEGWKNEGIQAFLFPIDQHSCPP